MYRTKRSARPTKEIKFPIITLGYGVSVIGSFPSARALAVSTGGDKQPQSILHLNGVQLVTIIYRAIVFLTIPPNLTILKWNGFIIMFNTCVIPAVYPLRKRMSDRVRRMKEQFYLWKIMIYRSGPIKNDLERFDLNYLYSYKHFKYHVSSRALM